MFCVCIGIDARVFIVRITFHMGNLWDSYNNVRVSYLYNRDHICDAIDIVLYLSLRILRKTQKKFKKIDDGVWCIYVYISIISINMHF
jgi:hypothetical protein